MVYTITNVKIYVFNSILESFIANEFEVTNYEYKEDDHLIAKLSYFFDFDYYN